jgi:hypothetical protein
VNGRTARLLVLVLALVTVGPASVGAQSLPTDLAFPTGPRPDSWHLWNGLAGGWNPPVLGDMLKVYRKFPFGNGQTLLTCDSHWRAGAHVTLTPTYARPGAFVGLSPWLFLDVDVSYGPGLAWFHYEFDGYGEPYDDDARSRIGRTEGLYHHVMANVVLKAAVWRFAWLLMGDTSWYHAKQHFFHWEIGTILKTGFDVRGKAFWLLETWKGLRVFANYEYYRYFPTAYVTQLVSGGVLALGWLPWGTSLLIQGGWHVDNPDWHGFKIWAAAFWEWDFPDVR